MTRHAATAVGVIALLSLVSGTALACPVCLAPSNDENTTAFALMTGFLTLLPLALIGSGVWWYVRRLKEFDRREARTRARRIPRRRAAQPERGAVLTAPEGYFERGSASTVKGR